MLNVLCKSAPVHIQWRSAQISIHNSQALISQCQCCFPRFLLQQKKHRENKKHENKLSKLVFFSQNDKYLGFKISPLLCVYHSILHYPSCIHQKINSQLTSDVIQLKTFLNPHLKSSILQKPIQER